ncbi:MAG: autoinducer binding domain-containing protein [Lautropia sp.]|nr:autoinducer binding domain-containing protein [Lautropia sp.]
MEKWQEELIHLHPDGTTALHTIFHAIEKAAYALEFDYVAYDYQAALPASKPHVTLINNYPEIWQKRYRQAGYLKQDPRLHRCIHTNRPVIWNDELFADAPALWHDARQCGLCHGWSQPLPDVPAGAGVLSLVRPLQALTARELNSKASQMQWLAHVTHTLLSHRIRHDHAAHIRQLTDREIEVLKWTADGKSSQDIADILKLSKNTVDFHIKNTVKKLNVPNKTAAVVQALILGLIN